MSIATAKDIVDGMTSPYEEDQAIINDLTSNLDQPLLLMTPEDVEDCIKMAEHLELEAVDTRLRGEAIWLNTELRKSNVSFP